MAKYSIPLMRPWIDADTRARVNAVLDSGMLTEGAVTREFEAAVRDFLGGGRVIAVTSATTGLEVALRALGIGPGDEVIVPDFTYPASAHAVCLVGATPVLVDVHPRRMTIDPAAVAAAVTPRTKAVMPVSAFGNPVDYDAFAALKHSHGFAILEDAAPALGARYRDVPVGRFADITVFSLHPRKSITTGEGGLIVTAREDLADWMLSYKYFGMQVENGATRPVFERVGTNYKLSNILAAVGLGQMAAAPRMIERRIALCERYTALLAGTPGVAFQETQEHGFHSRQSYIVFVEQRDAVMQRLRGLGIEAQIGTYALHREPVYAAGGRARLAGSLEGSRWAYEHSLALPLFHELTAGQQDDVVGELKAAIAACAA